MILSSVRTVRAWKELTDYVYVNWTQIPQVLWVNTKCLNVYPATLYINQTCHSITRHFHDSKQSVRSASHGEDATFD